jgi:uncharacterized protein YkwD
MRGRTLLLVALVALLAPAAVLGVPDTAQAVGPVTGTVVDEHGDPVNSLEVRLTPEGGTTQTTTTSTSGAFSFVDVPAGTATIGFADPVYRQFVVDDATVPVGDAGAELGVLHVESTSNPGRSNASIGSTKAAVATAYRRQVAAAVRDERDLVPHGCKVAPTPLPAQRRTLRVVNFMRRLSGLDPVVLDPVLSKRAQKAAIIQHYQGFLSHSPSPTARCSTRVGRLASARSNLAQGFEGGGAVLAYMSDFGRRNKAVGHRRWILDPFTESMGAGQVARSNALYVVSRFSQANAVPHYVPWPVPGPFPAQLEPEGRWSFSVARRDISLAHATVKVSRAGLALGLRRYPPTPGYGDQSALVWDLRKDLRVRRSARLLVTISGISRRGVVLPPYSYVVLLFRA